MMKRQFFPIVAGFAALGFMGVAQAADFTFNVPVDVQNMEVEYTEGRVTCTVFESNTELGTGQQFFGLDSFGNHDDTLNVAVNVEFGAPEQVDRYECKLAMRNDNGDFVVIDGGGLGLGGSFRTQGSIGTNRP